ncbi:hypothetical protein CPT_Privateer_104 [Proteus phage Privateer]|uniref:Uncharacterized protein n=1 Tax=Proteus phage Privateer TaxID=2712958 RepID=A0A6G8R3W2_9CAUD|nr:hypothetical protein HWD17_gp104 [Proteus phage Privateer]QIN94897.1 hypothetical protein CPT_Privateer_104 [Proteus phage Privateer]
MKIKFDKDKQLKEFTVLRYGDVFLFKEKVYLKIIINHTINAISMTDMKPAYFKPEDRVELKSSELIIKDL